MLAAGESAKAREERRAADIVVAVRGGGDPGEAARTAQRVGRELRAAYTERPAVVLLLSDGRPGAPPEPAGVEPVTLLPWSHPGQGEVEALLRAAESFGASAAALVSPDGDAGPLDAARHLLGPVLEGGHDLVSPVHASHRFDGVLSTGIVYPLLRALFGKRLRQPLGEELAVSRGLAMHLLGQAWHADPAHAGDRLWLTTSVLAGPFRVCEAYVGPRARRAPEAQPDLAGSLAQVLGILFHEMRRQAATWQRVKGSRPVPAFGEPQPPPGDLRPPAVGSLLSAFQLGYQELGRLWGLVMPPQTLLTLKRLSLTPEASFGIDDAVWARIVYDFAVGYHLALMDRALLLRSLTPLYLGWVAGFVRETGDLEPAAVEGRVERLCRAFEAAKPYLISRWRWPDRFNP